MKGLSLSTPWLIPFAQNMPLPARCDYLLPTVVIVVVAKLIAHVLLTTTPEFAAADTFVALAFISTIEAFALFAVFEVFVATTISSVPLASGVVVHVVAVTVTFPRYFLALSLGILLARIVCCLRFVIAVEALALRTEFEIFGTATISTVPATATVIIAVVTVVVAFVLRFCATFVALL